MGAAVARLAPSGTACNARSELTRSEKTRTTIECAFHIPDATLATPVVPFGRAKEVQAARLPVIPDLLVFVDAQLADGERELVLAALAAAEDASDVISLTSETFESTLKGEALALVEFFAPWCGHCKALAPHYEEAATELKNKSIKLTKVDCVDQADLCQQQGITGYP